MHAEAMFITSYSNQCLILAALTYEFIALSDLQFLISYSSNEAPQSLNRLLNTLRLRLRSHALSTCSFSYVRHGEVLGGVLHDYWI